jgi:phosphate transport system substrate-binding protein
MIKYFRLAVLTIILVSITLSGCKKDVLTISGSETMYPMLKILEEDYNQSQGDIRLIVKGGGSKLGLRNLVSGKADMAASSLEFEEALSAQLSSIDAYEVTILAYDGIAIVVNNKNPVERLHLKQISDMFAGKIKNWREVGGPSMPVLPVVRNDNSGTAAYMKRHILRQMDLGELLFEKFKDMEYAKGARIAGNNREIADIISKNINAISYMGMGSAETEGRNKVKKIRYAVTPRGPFVLPDPVDVEKRRYMLSRPLMLVYKKNGKKEKDFITYVKSKRAQSKIKSSGYLDILHKQMMLKTLTIKGD